LCNLSLKCKSAHQDFGGKSLNIKEKINFLQLKRPLKMNTAKFGHLKIRHYSQKKSEYGKKLDHKALNMLTSLHNKAFPPMKKFGWRGMLRIIKYT